MKKIKIKTKKTENGQTSSIGEKGKQPVPCNFTRNDKRTLEVVRKENQILNY